MKNIVTRVGLTEETSEKLEELKTYFKRLEEGMNGESFSWRLENGQFDRDELIKKALDEYLRKNKE